MSRQRENLAASTDHAIPENFESLVTVALSVAAALQSRQVQPGTRNEEGPRRQGGPALISIPQAAEELGLSRASAYRYANQGKLPIKRFGRRVYVVRELLDEFMRSTVVDSSEVDAA